MHKNGILCPRGTHEILKCLEKDEVKQGEEKNENAKTRAVKRAKDNPPVDESNYFQIILMKWKILIFMQIMIAMENTKKNRCIDLPISI